MQPRWIQSAVGPSKKQDVRIKALPVLLVPASGALRLLDTCLPLRQAAPPSQRFFKRSAEGRARPTCSNRKEERRSQDGQLCRILAHSRNRMPNLRLIRAARKPLGSDGVARYGPLECDHAARDATQSAVWCLAIPAPKDFPPHSGSWV